MTIFSQNLDKIFENSPGNPDYVIWLYNETNIYQMPKFDSIRYDTKFSITFSVKINTSGLYKNHFRSD